MSEVPDFLRVDPELAGQKFCCVSLISPYTTQKSNEARINVRGVYDNMEECTRRANYLNRLRKKERNNKQRVDIGIVPVGMWIPWYQDCSKESNVQSALDELNLRVGDIIKAHIKGKEEFEKRKQEKIEQAKEETEKKKKMLEEMSGAGTIIEEVEERKDEEIGVIADDAFPKVKQATILESAVDEPSDKPEEEIQRENEELMRKLRVENEVLKLKNDKQLDEQIFVCISFVKPKDKSGVSGYKIRGVFKTMEEAKERAKYLSSLEEYFDIPIGMMGHWLKYDPDPETIEEHEYLQKDANEFFKGYRNNQQKSVKYQEKVKSIEQNEMYQKMFQSDDVSKP